VLINCPAFLIRAVSNNDPMNNLKIVYPIMIIKENDSNLYALSKDLGLISKGGESFYKGKIKIIDKLGKLHELLSVKKTVKAKFIDSVRYFQPMHQMNLELNQIGQLTLNELKEIIIDHIRIKPKHWQLLGTIEMITEQVKETKEIPELIEMFK
jgi:hypothetical protein